ncbi:hypothetical protein [Streptomyces sp. NPDC058872]|uniref:hypothetical protein n=1 Tax=Streptomyces sp. NPDC058872 TaxID=3346661 RepID=UPI0036AAE525
MRLEESDPEAAEAIPRPSYPVAAEASAALSEEVTPTGLPPRIDDVPPPVSRPARSRRVSDAGADSDVGAV